MSLFRISTTTIRSTSRSLQQRGLVSTVLLTKQWNDQSVADLRKEAKSRGLPSSGNKATLITRIQEHETRSTLDAISSQPIPISRPTSGQVRHAHVINTPTPTAKSAAPASDATAPGVPPAHTPKYDKQFLNVKIPDLSLPEPEPVMQIPFGPDFWHSKSAASSEPKTASPPKLLVVAGSAVHPGTAPSVHETLEAVAPASSSTAAKNSSRVVQGGIFADMAEDLGVSTLFKPDTLNEQANQILDGIAEKTEAFGGERASGSRLLDEDERRGAWTLGGILVGAFLLGGFFDAGSISSRKAADAKAKAHATAADMKAKAMEAKDGVSRKIDEAKTKVVG